MGEENERRKTAKETFDEAAAWFERNIDLISQGGNVEANEQQQLVVGAAAQENIDRLRDRCG